MVKKLPFYALSSVYKCSHPNCHKKIKMNVVNRKEPPYLCYKHFKEHREKLAIEKSKH